MNETLRLKLKTVKFFIEANPFEYHTLLEKYKELLKWEFDNQGGFLHVGDLILKDDSECPVNIMLRFAIVNDIRICFYHPCSRMVDFDMINDYLFEHFPVKYDQGTRRAFEDAENFHNVYSFLKQERNKRIKLTNENRITRKTD